MTLENTEEVTQTESVDTPLPEIESQDVDTSEDSTEERELSTSEVMSKVYEALEKGEDASKFKKSPATQEEEAKPSEKTIAPPSGWTADDKQLFSSLPRGAQEAVLRREQERDKGFQQKVETLTRQYSGYKDVDSLISPLEAAFPEGYSKTELMKDLIHAHKYLLDDPESAIEDIARANGLTVRVEKANEETNATARETKLLETKVSELERRLEARDAEEKKQVLNSIQSEVERCFLEKDKNGNPVRPYVQEVGEVLPHFIELEKQKGIEGRSYYDIVDAAYHKAVRADDVLWKKEIERLKAEELNANKSKIENARRLNMTSLKGSAGSARSTPTFKSTAEAMAHFWDELS